MIGDGDGGHGSEVYLNIYDLNDDLVAYNRLTFDMLSLGGAFHAGIELFQNEWSYGSEGIFRVQPRKHEYHVFRQTVRMGHTNLDLPDVCDVLRAMMGGWGGKSYDLLQKNCCAFANSFCESLGVGPIPNWVNRLAQVGSSTLFMVQQVAAAVGLPDDEGFSPQSSVASRDTLGNSSSAKFARRRRRGEENWLPMTPVLSLADDDEKLGSPGEGSEYHQGSPGEGSEYSLEQQDCAMTPPLYRKSEVSVGHAPLFRQRMMGA